MAIEVTWIGTAGEPVTLMQQVAGHVEQIFGGAASVRAARRLPDGAYDVRRRQYASRALLMTLAGGAGDHKVLGITDVDLFIPVLTFVFGEAQLGGRVAVVSTARLADAGPHGMRARLMKEAVHELGHTYGLVHCASPACAMARSASIAAVDVKSDRLCSGCRLRLAELMKESAYVTAHPENPDRR